jgi:hypothetical protein
MAEAVTEKVEEVAEEFISDLTPEHLAKFGAGALGAAAALSALAGAAAGYAVAMKKLRQLYEARAEEEIAQMRDHFHAKALAMEEKPALDGLVKDLGYVPVTEKGQVKYDQAEQEAIADVNRNVFEDAEVKDEWDYETEVAARSKQMPYIIHVDEKGETGLDCYTFTYYAGDDVICDERDKVIDDKNALVGDHNLDQFGHGSNDASIVYVRNEELAVEIELVKSEGTYVEEVVGIKHADTRMRKRVRFDDDPPAA